MNQFDFYFVKVSSQRKTDLKKAGIAENAIQSERDFVTVGRKRYPRTRYYASVGFQKPDEAGSKAADATAATFRAQGLSAGVKYHVSD